MTERCYVPSQYHLHRLAQTKPELAWDGQAIGPWQNELRARLVDLLGGLDFERSDPNVEELDREETDLYLRRKLVFTAAPCADVPCHLLVPKRITERVPAVVCLQGHSTGMHISIGEAKYEGDEESIAGGRDLAVQAAANGYVALAVEQRCFGERKETLQEQRSQHGCLDAAMHALLLGDTLIGERVWDTMRAIDLLAAQPEVDPDRIAVMGNSGGGTITFFTAAVDERVHLPVPSCYFCTFGACLMRIYHCTDNYIPGILRVADMGDLAGLFVPRPVIFVAGEEDPIFPIAGVREAFAKARAIYTAAGIPDRCALLVGPAGHQFYPDLAWPRIRAVLDQ